MTRIRVPIIGGNNKSVLIDSTATKGSTIGVNLLMSDGTLVTPAKLAAYIGVTPNPPNKPPNNTVTWTSITGKPGFPAERPAGEDGMDGDQGPPGADGKQGAPGLTGGAGAPIPGEDGMDGDHGPPGERGPVGATGISNMPGPPGPPGDDGMDGEPGPPGSAGPLGAAGAVGVGLIGPPGDDGLDGDHGPPGERGATGPVSAIPGPPGPPGDDGLDGEPGVPGPTNFGAPSALLGLIAITGVADRAMRSDGAPALNVTISPTWTGLHIFNVTGGTQILTGTTTVNANRLGGTDAAHLIDITNDNTALQVIRISTYGSAGLGGENNMHWFRARGTLALPTATKLNDTFMSMGYRGYGATGVSNSSAAFSVVAAEDFTDAATGTNFIFAACPTGSVARQNLLILSANGSTLYAPSALGALVLASGLYTFGNATDNPQYTFAGTGSGTIGGTWQFKGANNAIIVGGTVNTSYADFRNGSNVSVLNIGSVFSWAGSGSTTDGAIGSAAGINLYADGEFAVTTMRLKKLALTFGNTTDNPTYGFLGTGLATFSGGVTVVGLTTPSGGLVQTHTPGSHTIPAGYFGLYIDNFTLTGVQQLVLAGTARLRVL